MQSRLVEIPTTTRLITEDCPNCGVVFALPQSLQDERRREGGKFYCPNGHGMSYTESDSMKYKHQLEQREAELQRTHELLRARETALDGALKEVSNKKREVTRLRNRAKAGVCSECNRTIKEAADHMASCHKGQEEARRIAQEHSEGK